MGSHDFVIAVKIEKNGWLFFGPLWKSLAIFWTRFGPLAKSRSGNPGCDEAVSQIACGRLLLETETPPGYVT